MIKFTIIFLGFLPFWVYSQFAPAAGKIGSTAIYKDSLIFANWVQEAEVYRGYIDIRDKSVGKVDYGEIDYVFGKPDGRVLSLGDSGVVVVRLDNPVINGKSWDFAIFENGFNDEFLELAFVEVSSDGENYFRFPCISLTDTTHQVETFGTLDTRKINGLAGKYRVNYGTPFDLDSIEDNYLLDKNNIRFIKIIDVIGSLDKKYASYDSRSNAVNDPFPTPFNSGGFDLDAVGIIHQKKSNQISNNTINRIKIYPNPVNDYIIVDSSVRFDKILIVDIYGEVVYQNRLSLNKINISLLKKGTYFIILVKNDKKHIARILKL